MSSRYPDNDFGYSVLVEEMREGYRDVRATIRENVDKAKANITAGTVVLGIIIAGTRVSSGLLGEAGEHALADSLIPAFGIPLVPTLVGLGMGAIVLSIAVSVGAIAAIRLNTPFGPHTILTKGSLDRSKLKAWERAPKKTIYTKICKEYAEATLRGEKVARRSGKAMAIGQISLVVGLVLTAAASVSALVALGS